MRLGSHQLGGRSAEIAARPPGDIGPLLADSGLEMSLADSSSTASPCSHRDVSVPWSCRRWRFRARRVTRARLNATLDLAARRHDHD